MIRSPTLDLNEGASLLKIHPATLLAKAKAGEIPGAKPGKCWVFIESDLLDYLRSLYSANRQGASDCENGDKPPCSLKDQQAVIGIINSPSKEKLYTEALEPATKKKRRK